MSEDEARRIFYQVEYPPTDEDVQRLSENINILKGRDLDKVTKRLIEVSSKGRKFRCMTSYGKIQGNWHPIKISLV